MTVIIDYGVGNIRSLQNGFSRAGTDTVLSSEEDVIRNADMLILPGVGAFKDAKAALDETGLIPAIMDHVRQGKPLVGICLGMQLLFEESHEDGMHQGLGLLEGAVRKIPEGLRIPHMGWNALDRLRTDDPLASSISNGDHVYFVHSYYCDARNEDIVATASYGIDIPAIVRRNNVIGMQFHPEKSASVGRAILETLKEMTS
jgi:imidazole glycerol-phosphate synthase subunit HisH